MRGWRCATASKTNIPVEGPACLTSIVVAAGEATATIPGGHSFAVGGGVGTFEFAESTMNRTDRVVTAVTSTTVKWAEPTAPSGTYTDGQVSAYAHNLNKQWKSIKDGCTFFTSWDVPLTDTGSEQAERPLDCAIVWYVSRDATARQRARQIILDPLQLVYGTATCDTALTVTINSIVYNNAYCGRNSPGIDYGRGAAVNALRAYDILMTDDSMFTSGEEQRFRDIILTDFRDSPAATYSPTTFPAGTITVSGTSVTGSGTAFTSLAVGGVIWLKASSYSGFRSDEGQATVITAIASDTALTISTPKHSGTFTQATATNGDFGQSVWMYSRPWQSGDLGLWAFFSHHKNTLLGSSLIYKSHTGEADAVWQFNNLVITSQQFFVAASLAFLGEDSRALHRLTETWTMAADHTVAGAMSHLASGHPMGNNYIRGRGQYMYRTVTAMAKVFPTYPNMRGPWLWGINWTDIYTYNGGDYGRVPPMQDQAYFGQTGEDAVYMGPLNVQSGLDTLPALPTNLQRGFKNMLAVFSPAGDFADYAGGLRAFHGFEALNPQLTPLSDMSSFPLGLINDTTSRDLCAGWRWCRDANYVYVELVSRKSWNWDNTSVNFHAGAGTSDQDHLTPSWDAWWLNMGFTGGNQRCFMGTDDSDCALYIGYGETGKKNSVLMDRHSYEKYTDGQATVTYRANTSSLFAARSQFTNAVSALSPDLDSPDRAHRDYVRFLPSGGSDDILIIRSDLKTKGAGGSTPVGKIRTYTHYGNNGQTASAAQFIDEGNTTCAGSACSAGAVITGNIHSANANYRVVSNTVYPVSSKRGLRKTELANGAYTGGRGYTFRVETCATTDDATCANATELIAIEVHKLSTVADATTLTTSGLTVGAWDGVQVTGTTSTRVAMFAATCQTSMGAITTTATANVAAMGLCAGTYDLRLNGTTVCNAVVIATNDVLFCAGVGAGSVDIVADGGNSWYVSPSVTNTSGNGTIGNPCGLAAVLEGNCSTSPAIAAGDTIYLRAGVHLIGRYGAGLTTWRETSLAGTSGNPITFRSYPGEWARVDGGIIFNGSDIIWRDTEVFCSLTDKQSAENGSFPTDMYCPAALSAKAARIKFINNVIRNSGEIALWDTAPNSEAYGNINYYGGWRSLGGTGHGHGFYIQNNTGQHRVEANIVHNTFGQGVQVYGTSVSNLNNVFFDNNVWMRGGFANNNAGTPVPTRNFLIGGAVNAADMTVRHNHSFEGEVNLGYNGGSGQGCTNMEYSNSYSVTPNTIAYALNIADGIGGDLACNFNGSTTGNTRYGDPNGATLPGTNRILTAGTLPSTAEISVVPNIYETGRANIIVWNWPAASSVTVDVSSIGLTNGDTFAVKDSQNYFGTPARVGTYTGASISVPMNLTTVETPIWTDPTPAITHTSSQFNAFVIVRTGTSTVNITTTTLPSGTQGSAYSQALAADNCSPCVWSLASGSLPSGLTLASDGTISGTPSASGSFSITPQATIAATGALDITPPTISLTISAPSGGSGVSSTVRGVAIRGGTIR